MHALFLYTADSSFGRKGTTEVDEQLQNSNAERVIRSAAVHTGTQAKRSAPKRGDGNANKWATLATNVLRILKCLLIEPPSSRHSPCPTLEFLFKLPIHSYISTSINFVYNRRGKRSTETDEERQILQATKNRGKKKPTNAIAN